MQIASTSGALFRRSAGGPCVSLTSSHPGPISQKTSRQHHVAVITQKKDVVSCRQRKTAVRRGHGVPATANGKHGGSGVLSKIGFLERSSDPPGLLGQAEA